MRRFSPGLLAVAAACGGDPGAPGAGARPDAAAPPAETTITEAPAEVVASRVATFVFTSSPGGGPFTCGLDGGAATACAPPLVLTVEEGAHLLAVSAAGDPTPATHAWRVDLTPPETFILEGPAAELAASEAELSFSASEAGGSFACALDGAEAAACESPVRYSRLALGEHRFEVRATDRAVNPDPSPAVWIFTVTAITPETRIAGGPTSPWREASVTFELDADVAGVTFECQLDEEARAACATPVTYDNLAEGPHAFRAWAVDPGGHIDPSPAVHEFTVAFEYW